MLPKIAIVASHPIQHFCPLYKSLASDGRIVPKVFFGSTSGATPYYDIAYRTEIKWPGDLTSGFANEFLPGADVADPQMGVDCPGLSNRLDAYKPDVVQVYGFRHRLSWRALAWARRRGRPVLLVSDSELRTQRRFLTRLRKSLTVPFQLRLIDGFLTIGDNNERYYETYGADPSRFFRSPYPIASTVLDAAWLDRVTIRERLRVELGIDERAIMLLIVGKLTERKRPCDVIRALAKVRPSDGMVAVFAGEGVERAAVESEAFRLGVTKAIRLWGFVNPDKLAEFYVAADILVHPSSEDPHPLATSEAVYCGLPVVVSDRVGSVGPTDDVRIGENGVEYPVSEVESLAGWLQTLANDSERRRNMSRRSREIGQERTLDVSVDGYVRAVQNTLHGNG